MLTEEQKTRYVKLHGYHCPYCGEAKLEYGAIEAADDGATQDVFCCACDKSWKDVLTLTSIEEAEE